MNTVLEYGSEFVDQDIRTNMLKLIEENFNMNDKSFEKFLVYTYLQSISRPIVPDVMSKIVAWVFGEIGSKIYANLPERLEELIQILCRTLENHQEDEYSNGWILSAIANSRPTPTRKPRVRQRKIQQIRSFQVPRTLVKSCRIPLSTQNTAILPPQISTNPFPS